MIAGTWHDVITDGLIAGAERVLDAAGANHRLVRVPGSFELAVAAQAAFDGGADAVVALGVIIRGGTPHFEYVSAATTDGLTRVALDAGKPVGFGVLTLDDEQQGLDRAGLPGLERGQGRGGRGCRDPHRPRAARAARLTRLRGAGGAVRAEAAERVDGRPEPRTPESASARSGPQPRAGRRSETPCWRRTPRHT